MLTEGVRYDEIFPIHIPEQNMVADSFTKYITKSVWKKHLYYFMNFGADFPDGKSSHKGAQD